MCPRRQRGRRQSKRSADGRKPLSHIPTSERRTSRCHDCPRHRTAQTGQPTRRRHSTSKTRNSFVIRATIVPLTRRANQAQIDIVAKTIRPAPQTRQRAFSSPWRKLQGRFRFLECPPPHFPKLCHVLHI